MTKFEVFWIADETLSGVIDVSSQSRQRLRSKRRSKIVKIYANKDQVSKPPSLLSFSLFSLDELLMSLRKWGQTGFLLFDILRLIP